MLRQFIQLNGLLMYKKQCMYLIWQPNATHICQQGALACHSEWITRHCCDSVNGLEFFSCSHVTWIRRWNFTYMDTDSNKNTGGSITLPEVLTSTTLSFKKKKKFSLKGHKLTKTNNVQTMVHIYRKGWIWEHVPQCNCIRPRYSPGMFCCIRYKGQIPVYGIYHLV